LNAQPKPTSENGPRLATRDSPLALWQAHRVRDLFAARFPEAPVPQLVPLKSSGDVNMRPMAEVGQQSGVGIFTKTLDTALLEDRADFAVHSYKDYPSDIPDGLMLVSVPERASVRDCLVYPESLGKIDTAADLLNLLAEEERPPIGTSSPRRQAQLQLLHDGLRFDGIRGNVGTRLKKVKRGDYSALVMAEAGLMRMGGAEYEAMAGLSMLPLDPVSELVPAPAQGALAIVCRADAAELIEQPAALNDPLAQLTADAERATLAALGGGCFIPIGAYARIAEDTSDDESSDDNSPRIKITAVVTSPPEPGKAPQAIRLETEDSCPDPWEFGAEIADTLRAQGAEDLLTEFREE
jgi:hydroxymethylbilane synthase